MPETYQKKCIRCGNYMTITIKQMHKKRCDPCAIKHSRETSLKRYYLIKTNPEALTQEMRCEDCGILIERNRKLCNDCSIKRNRARAAIYQKAIAAGVRQKPKHCEKCGDTLPRDETGQTQKHCPACAQIVTGEQAAEAKKASPRAAQQYVCRRKTCIYYNRSVGCCDYRSIMKVGRGCSGKDCDKYKRRNEVAEKQEEFA